MKASLVALLILATGLSAQDVPQNVRPRLLNAGEVADSLVKGYRGTLLLGDWPMPTVRIFITPEGKTDSLSLRITSGSHQLDQISLDAAHTLRFTPARSGDVPVAMWLDVPMGLVIRQPSTDPNLWPRVVNRKEFATLFPAGNPQRSEDVDPGRIVDLAIVIGPDGSPTNVTVRTTSCSDRIDQNAKDIVKAMKFSSEGRTTAYMYLGPDTTYLHVAGDTLERPTAKYDRKPELNNRNTVAKKMVQSYPPAMRDAGLGGRTIVLLLIDEEGRPIRYHVRLSSSSCEIDNASLGVVGVMRFRPAELNRRPIRVWIQLPVVWKIQL